MEYLAYSLMDSAYAEATKDTEFSLPKLKLPELKLKFNWNRNFKSAWLTFALIGALLAILAQTQTATAAYNGPGNNYYVQTKGSDLLVRQGPSSSSAAVAFYPNGSRLPKVVGYANGFAKLSNGYYVSANWIGNKPGKGNTRAPGVGGPYTLSLGSQGSAVAELQRSLGLTPTAYYGPMTADAVKNYQRRNGLLVDGVAGPETLSALGVY
ncbi:peptidoglycan-binding protein [Scytonema tolypothrichoides VB-61278]|nr:peptidoglycan-binding protein [Scytonema tolypothrichoides VB-61278]